MKKDLNKSQAFVDKAMQHLEKDRYQANPYLYTRIKQQLENKQQNQVVRPVFVLWKPALALVMIALNVFTYYYFSQNQETAQLNAFAEEYSWETEESNYDYITLDAFQNGKE